jgi:serine/threonine protein kinase
MTEERRAPDLLAQLKQDSFLSANFQLLEVLGEGCFGKIVKAVNRKTSQTVALKLERFKKSKLRMVLKN